MKLAILGATGSIGRSALSVIRANPGRFEPVLFSAHTGRGELAPLKKEFPAARLVLASEEDLGNAVRESGAERALNGIAGAAGLAPSLAVLETGASLALANKETVVMAWNLVKKTADDHGAAVIPVDSEHSGVFALVNAHGAHNIEEIILTCSGGAFRECSAGELKHVRAQDALKHPTWQMGAKITIDSATLANKGLEVIEAARLFNMPPEKVKVVIHPQSIVHALVRLRDGAVYAQLSQPDMRLPIQSALCYPEMVPCPFAALDFSRLDLCFSPPDTERFPMLRLAYAALAAGGSAPLAYNAANEEAVALFRDDRIGFTDIPRIVETVLAKGDWTAEPETLEAALALDRRAREAVIS